MPRIPRLTVPLATTWFFTILLISGGEAPAALERAPADAAVRDWWETLDARWNERDGVRFSELFAGDVSFEFVDRGESLDGRVAVREHFVARFPTFAPELRHRTTVSDVRSLAPDVLAVDGKVEILRHDSSDATSALLRTFAIFAVMVRESEDWKVRVIRIYRLP